MVNRKTYDFTNMEQINRIELRGYVGFVHQNTFGESRMVRFSLGTSYFYKGADGTPVIETTWHNVSVWDGKFGVDISKIKKGAVVEVVGRMKDTKYTTADGADKHFFEVVPSSIRILEEKVPPQSGI